jgi:hypothetical protein
MRIFLFTISFILFANFKATADYSPMKLVQMTLEADTVLYATIEKVNKEYFWVSDPASHSRSTSIKVLKFRDWACAARWESYMVGQRVVLFLKKERGFYRIMSAGGEDELPVFGDSLMINALCLPYKKAWMVGDTGVRIDSLNRLRRQFGKSMYSYKAFYTISDFLTTVFNFRAIFKWNRMEMANESSEGENDAMELFTTLNKEHVQSRGR